MKYFDKTVKENTIMAKVTKSMLIGELLTVDPNIAPILMRAGMHCLAARLHRWNLWKKQQWSMAWTQMSS